MCDYSLQSVVSRPAKVGDKLTTRDFGTGTRGFAAAKVPESACVSREPDLRFARRLHLPKAATSPVGGCER